MSEYHSPEWESHIPGFEPWLGVMLASFIPALLMLVAPASLDIPLMAATALVGAVGLVMMGKEMSRIRAKARSLS